MTRLLAALLAFCWLSPAFASDPQLGRWALDLKNCSSFGGAHAVAPLTVMPLALRWGDEYCTVGKMYKADDALYIEGHCTVSDGIMKRHPITLAMKGSHLAVTWDGERAEMQRCR